MLEALLERTQTEPTTEPRLPAASDGKRCGYCSDYAVKDCVCTICHTPLCGIHTRHRMIAGEKTVLCPDCKGGG